jgi:hypothetical protein
MKPEDSAQVMSCLSLHTGVLFLSAAARPTVSIPPAWFKIVIPMNRSYLVTASAEQRAGRL